VAVVLNVMVDTMVDIAVDIMEDVGITAPRRKVGHLPVTAVNPAPAPAVDPTLAVHLDRGVAQAHAVHLDLAAGPSLPATVMVAAIVVV